MLPCSWVAESGYVRASLLRLTPLSNPGAVELRTVNASNPTPEPTRPGVRTAVAERQGDHAVRHSGEEPNGELERTAGIVDADPILAGEAKRLGRLRADERGVVPGQLRQWIGKLLQPPVVREAAVVKRRGGEEDDLQAAARSARGSSGSGCACAAANRARELRQRLRGELWDNLRKLAAGKESIMQDAVPLPVELGFAQDRFPGLPHDVVAGTILVSDHQPKHFDRRSSTEQGEMSGWTTLSVPPTARASPHDSR